MVAILGAKAKSFRCGRKAIILIAQERQRGVDLPPVLIFFRSYPTQSHGPTRWRGERYSLMVRPRRLARRRSQFDSGHFSLRQPNPGHDAGHRGRASLPVTTCAALGGAPPPPTSSFVGTFFIQNLSFTSAGFRNQIRVVTEHQFMAFFVAFKSQINQLV